MLAADRLEVLLLHDSVKNINRAAINLTFRNSNLAQVGPSMTRQAFACLVPAATQLAHVDLIISV